MAVNSFSRFSSDIMILYLLNVLFTKYTQIAAAKQKSRVCIWSFYNHTNLVEGFYAAARCKQEKLRIHWHSANEFKVSLVYSNVVQ